MPLIPHRRTHPLDGRFAWPARIQLASPRNIDHFALGQLADDLRSAKPGRSVELTLDASSPATLRIARDPRIAGSEAYRLVVRPGGIDLFSASDAGAYYGIQSLREWLAEDARTLPSMVISDAPDFPRRGVYLDCSRGRVPTQAYLKTLIAQLGHWKYNELQLYIENVFTFARHPAISEGFCPFTPGELADLQEECRRHHIRFVPSLASFGHFERTLSLPAYQHLGEQPGLWGYPGGTTLCPGDPGSIRLVADLYDEFLPLFEATDFNACCDETWELGKGRSAARVGRVGMGPVYLGFIRKLHRLADRHGKRLNIWSDIVLNHPAMLPEVPRDIVMLNWDYHPRGRRMRRSGELAEAGLAFVGCPGTNAWQSHGSRLRQAMGNAADFAREARRHGAEGYLMTDWGDFGHRNLPGASLHGIAYGAAQAWNGRAVDSEDFTRRFCAQIFGKASAETHARLLETLGRSEEQPGAEGLYHVFSSPLLPGTNPFRGLTPRSPVWMPERHRRDRIAEADAEASAALLGELDALPRPPRPKGRRLHPLATDTHEDLLMALQMNRLALRCILHGKALRGGTPPAVKSVRALRTDLTQMAQDFAHAWLRQSRPSRLSDNLRLLTNHRP